MDFLVNGTNILIQEILACKVRTPLDGGESILPLCQVIQQFMPEKFMPAIATTAACLIGAKYLSILNMFGCCVVPMLTGVPGKSEAAKCELALFSAHKSHCFNNQSTPSYFIKIVKKTTIPVVIDNISAKAAGMVECCLLMPTMALVVALAPMELINHLLQLETGC